ncbi:MAG: aldolase [Comamonadaceae bacterium]|nr:MAG: aldolase [Comamonadaceae bacterium]
MIQLLQITNDPDLARRCDALDGMRLFVDLERQGKAERQAGRNTFISAHEVEDVARIKAVLHRTPLMVRVNPLNVETPHEVDAVIARGADMLMLPMFSSGAQLREFSSIVAGRKPIVPLLETAQALESVEDWVSTPGLCEVFVGLNDLHISMGCRFMFEPLSAGAVDRVQRAARRQGLRFGFGGIARMDQGLLQGQDVLAEHVRLGSDAVILSRTFHGAGSPGTFEDAVRDLRQAECALALRSAAQTDLDRDRIHRLVNTIADSLAAQRTNPAATP